MSDLHLVPAPDPGEPLACSCTDVPSAEGVAFDTLAVATWPRRHLSDDQELCVHPGGVVSFASKPGEPRYAVRAVRGRSRH